MHLRLYALSFHDGNGRIAHEPGEGRIQPMGVFSEG